MPSTKMVQQMLRNRIKRQKASGKTEAEIAAQIRDTVIDINITNGGLECANHGPFQISAKITIPTDGGRVTWELISYTSGV